MTLSKKKKKKAKLLTLHEEASDLLNSPHLHSELSIRIPFKQCRIYDSTDEADSDSLVSLQSNRSFQANC